MSLVLGCFQPLFDFDDDDISRISSPHISYASSSTKAAQEPPLVQHDSKNIPKSQI
ncbi:hypothetical protein OCU04_007828 [Sclerotinia nivalis]|uniref:Uncharacterized protein n=1 Tax=Sclerotinia nivalis TaxID=352851 RepID=A0A9X0AKJ1_9HELO|nr:hypothetical protein OCU04_007828 [Sclerotinia nivalis]